MREKLKRMNGRTGIFTAPFIRFVRTPQGKNAFLVGEVRAENGERLTDHLYLHRTQEIYKSQPKMWDRLVFRAKVTWYTKGQNEIDFTFKGIQLIAIQQDERNRNMHPQGDQQVLNVQRSKQGKVTANIPTYALHHSPSGFEFGYVGSGPSDLALNMLHHALKVAGYKGALTEPLWSLGQVYKLAWDLHQEFSRDQIASRPHPGEGGFEMTWVDICRWIDQRRPGYSVQPEHYAILGSREFEPLFFISHTMRNFRPPVVIVTCRGKGVNDSAIAEAESQDLPLLIFETHTKRLGMTGMVKATVQAVENCDRVTIFWDGKSSGMRHAMLVALDLNKPLTVVYPWGQSVTDAEQIRAMLDNVE